MTTITVIIIAASAAIVAGLLVYFVCRARFAQAESARRIAEQRLSDATSHFEERLAAEKTAAEERLAAEKAAAESRLAAEKAAAEERLAAEKAAAESRLAAEKSAAQERLEAEKEHNRQSVKELKESQKEVIEATKASLVAENEKNMKAREESLKQQAAETVEKATAGLAEQIKRMGEAFEAQKRSHTEEVASIKTKFDETAKHLGAQSERIGNKAEKLAEALRHDNKMQGNWGEMKLTNIFEQEGLVKGRDYERECYLRDKKGNILVNDESGKRMRPDFILHFPDNTDVIVDSKMNIDAYVDWYNAQTEEDRSDAARRNLEAMKSQIRGLVGKSYNEYVEDGHKTLPYVIMYVSNYGALALARQLEPSITNDAFKQNVLITTEETIMPFLRLIHSAWITVDQVRNQEKIMAAAARMVERVADLCEASESVGKKLDEAVKAHNTCAAKIAEGGQSIRKAAQDVLTLGVQANPKKVQKLNDDKQLGI